MKALLAIAASLAVLLAAAHSYLGERYILVRLFRRDNLPKLFGDTTFTRHTLRFAWHITSVAWLGFAALLGTLPPLGAGTPQAQLRVISVTFGVSGLVTLLGSRARHLAWIVFLAIAALVWIASA